MNKETTTCNPAEKKAAGSKLSVKRFTMYALVLTVLFACVHLLGFREYTSILSGTASFGTKYQYYGVLYLLLYICFVVIVPILLTGSLLIVCINKRLEK